MQILKDGDLTKSNKQYKFECKNCDCVYIATKEEYQLNIDVRYGTLAKSFCPFCKEEVMSDTIELKVREKND